MLEKITINSVRRMSRRLALSLSFLDLNLPDHSCGDFDPRSFFARQADNAVLVHCTALFDVRVDVSGCRSRIFNRHLYSEEFVFAGLFIDDLPRDGILFHLASQGDIRPQHPDQLLFETRVPMLRRVGHPRSRRLSLLFAHFKGVEALIEALTVEVVIELQPFALQHQAHGQDDVTFLVLLHLSLGLAPLDLEHPFAEQSLYFQVLQIDFGPGEPFALLLAHFAHVREDELGEQLLLLFPVLVARDRQLDHSSVPGQRFEPFLHESPLGVPFMHLRALEGDLVALLDFSADALKGETLMSLINCHAKFNQALDLTRQELVAHVGLVGDDFLPQRPCHLDAFVLEQDLGGSRRALDQLLLRCTDKTVSSES